MQGPYSLPWCPCGNLRVARLEGEVDALEILFLLLGGAVLVIVELILKSVHKHIVGHVQLVHLIYHAVRQFYRVDHVNVMCARSPLCTEYTGEILGGCCTQFGCRILLVEEGGLQNPLAHDTVAALHLPSVKPAAGILQRILDDIIREDEHGGSERL